LRVETIGALLSGVGSCADRFSAFPFLCHAGVVQEDLQRALTFAKKHAMRLVVMSTGHDYDGRSTAPDALMVSMKALHGIVQETIDLPEQQGATVLKVETGNTFSKLYAFADSIRGTLGERLVVVGGSDGSVGIGGWTMGGGHSALSRMYVVGTWGFAGSYLLEA
jgi:FAD/FMN-containing dehydrogenase